MPKLSTEVPKYRKHASGQAFVRINGHDVYLGVHGTERSKTRYDEEIKAYLAARAGQPIKAQASGLTVGELVVEFWTERGSEYIKHGEPTTEHHAFRRVLAKLNEQFGLWPVDEFGPLAMKSLRAHWVDEGFARLSCNRNARKVIEVFRWGVENERVSAATLQSLKAVKGLRKGRTDAPEPEPVLPVGLDQIEATMPHLSPVVRDMIRMQLLTGARPGEVCKIRPCDIDRSQDVWVYRPSSHKTEHHGKEREIYIGPEAQSVLLSYLLRPSDSHCFSAFESKEWFREQATAKRVTPPSCGNARGRKSDRKTAGTDRLPRSFFDTSSYGHAIARGCEKAWPAPETISFDKEAVKRWHSEHRWSPNQLRHTRATEVRRKYGLEAAQVILGHASANVTQIYAERDRQLGMRVAGESG